MHNIPVNVQNCFLDVEGRDDGSAQCGDGIDV
jgi:hypothetical protein